MRFTDLIAYQGLLEPGKPAIIAGGKIVTFGMLERAVQSVANRLVEMRLAPGSVVGLSIAVPSRHLAVSLALARCGLVSAPFISPAGLARLPDLALALTDEGMSLGGGRIGIAVTDEWFAPTDGPAPAVVDVPDDADCRIFMSSGTTGMPKPIFQTFGGMDAQANVVALHHALAGGCTRIFCGMGLKSAWGFRSTIAALANGMSVYFADGADETLRTVMIYGCDYMICSVHQLRELVQAQRESLTPVPSLRAVCTGGSIIPVELVRPAQSLLCSRIILIYGSSEVGHSALEIADVHRWQDGATGFVTPWTEIEAIDEQRRRLPPGESGELRVRSFAQAKFGGMPAEDGGLPWFYPGDRGMVSADGRVSVTGRTVDILNVGGMKISSERIEHVLMRHPNIVDAGVLGVADGDGLTEIRAAVAVRAPVAEADLQAFVARSLPAAVPKSILTVAEIPRGDTGKILKDALRELLR